MEELLIISKLVRMSVFGTEEELPVGINWPKVFVDAGLNGVSAICYEAVKRLPASLQPEFSLMLRWDLSAQAIREGFHHRHEVTRELCGLLAERCVDMLLLKGESLADNYPQPDLRESGDVDFVALAVGRSCPDVSPLSGYDTCNEILTRLLGVELDTLEQKHSGFEYRGVHFENHTLEQTEGYNRTHHRTMALLKESLPKAVRRSDGCLELDPVTQAVFVVKHAAQHLCYSGGKIALRMLLDLALLLRRHPEIRAEWGPALKRAGLTNFAEMMLCSIDILLSGCSPETCSGPKTCSGPMPGFRPDRSSRTSRRARRFIRLFLTESNRPARYFAKFAFLPLRPSEVLSIWYKKATGTQEFPNRQGACEKRQA